MNNEFGYLDIEPFTKINEKEQKLAIINQLEDKLEIKVNDSEKFSIFDFIEEDLYKLIEPKIFYGINSVYQPLTLYNCKIENNNWNAIPSSKITSKTFIIGKDAQSPIVHFTDKTKIKKIEYFNEFIKYIFPNNTMTITSNKNEIKIEAKKQKSKTICRASCNNNIITIKLINTYNTNNNIYNFNIKPISYFEITFKKSVNLDFVLKISNRIDSIIHLFLLTENQNRKITLYDTKGNSYKYIELKNKNNNEKQPTFYLGTKEENINNFDKLFNLFINIHNTSNINSFFTFLNYYKKISLLEIQFSDYYKTLEHTNKEQQKEKGKCKNKLFLLELLKKYPKVKEKYFKNEKDEIIEEEIRSLRNYYSHDGYYIKELPVPTQNPKYYKKITHQWIYNIKMFIKTITYLEVYSLANIKIDELYLIMHLK